MLVQTELGQLAAPSISHALLHYSTTAAKCTILYQPIRIRLLMPDQIDSNWLPWALHIASRFYTYWLVIISMDFLLGAVKVVLA